jgi:exopolyphosphatase/guanosine-5'-triphosphate,3'-diphosphate pyrophosphatase
MHLGVVDLGSNSFHLLVVAIDEDGALTKLESDKEMVRMGAGTLRDRFIDTATWSRALAALARLVARARTHRVDRIVAVATSAVRDARNGAEFVEDARRTLGIDIHVLSGEDEARLVYLGARSGLAAESGRTAVIDVGGGSVEIAVGEDSRILDVHSLPLGVLRLRDALVPADGTVSPRTAARIRGHVLDAAASATHAVLAWQPRRFVFTSGTARTIHALARRLADRGGLGDELVPTDVRRVAVVLSKFRPHDLAILGIEEGRRDTIAVGAIVVEALFELLRIEEAEVSRRALREGVAIACAHGPSQPLAAHAARPGPDRLGPSCDSSSPPRR